MLLNSSSSSSKLTDSHVTLSVCLSVAARYQRLVLCSLALYSASYCHSAAAAAAAVGASDALLCALSHCSLQPQLINRMKITTVYQCSNVNEHGY